MLWHCLEASAEAASASQSARLANGKYHCPFAVVSKCALREKKEGGPWFPGDLPTDLIVLRQLLHQVILQLRQLNSLNLRQHLF